MKKSLRWISLLLALLFVVSGAMMIACCAEDDPGAGGNDPGAGIEDPGTGGNDPGTGGNDPGTGDNPGTGVDDPGTGGNTGTGGESGTGGETGTGGDVDNNTGNGDDDYSGYSNQGGGSYEEDPISYGNTGENGNQPNASNEVITSDNVASGSTTIKSSGISEEDVKPNEWSAITLSDTSQKDAASTPKTFKQIKENTKTEDDSFWMLYLGYALIALAGLGILYFIIATIAHRSAVKKAERMERRRAARSAPAGYYAQEAYYEPTPKKTGSRHADGAPSRVRRGSAKADTGEVYVPRRAAKRSR